jgi:hypothetical protein
MAEMAHEADYRLVLPCPDVKGSVASKVSGRIREDWRDLQQMHRHPDIDWSFEIALIPAGGYLLGLHYAEQGTLVDELLKFPKVEAYPYWNNTDAPKGVSNRAWKARGKEWDRVLGGKAPAVNGFTYQITAPDPRLWRDEHDETLQPSKDERVRRVGKEVALSRFWNNDRPQDEGIQELFRIQDWLRDTEDGHGTLAAILEEVAGVLPESYRFEDFLVEPAIETDTV